MTRRIADRYLLGEQIGAGGSARVHEALDERLDRRVAIKLLNTDLVASADPAGRERFLREGPTAASFSHRHAVTVYDAGEDDGDLYIVMELVDGPSLAQHLARTGPLAIDEATRIAQQVLDALSAAHAVGIVHRDVKPANILLGVDGEIKLADFGIAKRFDDLQESLTRTGTVIGTPRYLAPEQTKGAEVSYATDVYAMGIVLFEMLAGRTPFTGDTHVAVAMAQQAHVAPDVRSLRPDASAPLAATVARALSRVPADRYPTAREMAADLEHSWSPPLPASPVATQVMTTALPPMQSAQAGDTRIMPADGATAVSPASPTPERKVPGRVVAVTIAFILLVIAIAAIALSESDANDQSSGSATSVTQASTIASATPPSTGPSTTPATTTARSTSPPTSVDEIIPGFAATDSLQVFVRQLEEDPVLVGSAGVALAGELNQILDENSTRQRRDKAKQVRTQLGVWVDDGELDPAIAAALDAVLAPLAAKGK